MTVYTKVGTDALANTTTSYDQHQSTAVRLNDGSLLAVWADTGTLGGVADSVIRGQRYTGTGEKIGGEIVISTDATSDVREPAITVLSNGDYVVTWSFWTGSYDSWTDIHGQRFAADGTPIGGEFVVTHTADNQTQSKVVSIATGGFVATWVGWAGSPLEMHIVSQQFDASGNKVGGEEILNPGGGGNPSGPSVSTHATGYLISWSDQGQALARFYNADGSSIGGEVVIDDAAYVSQLNVEKFSDNSLIFSWLRQDQDGVQSYVAQKYDSQGQKIGSEILLHGYGVDTPQIAVLENGASLPLGLPSMVRTKPQLSSRNSSIAMGRRTARSTGHTLHRFILPSLP